MDKIKKYKEIFVGEVSKTELDLEPPYWVETEDGQADVRVDVVLAPEISNSYVDTDVSMEIDEVISILERLKAKGADRVYIADHCDHHGYYFYGVRLEEVEEEDNLLEGKTKEQVLELIRNEYPNHVIHYVRSFEKNIYGIYKVHVDMQIKLPVSYLLDTSVVTIHHANIILPYPNEKYQQLTPEQKRSCTL